MLEEITTHCPYCGESLQLLADISGGDQDYYEDCQVCCRPILMKLSIDNHSGSYQLLTHRDDE